MDGGPVDGGPVRQRRALRAVAVVSGQAALLAVSAGAGEWMAAFAGCAVLAWTGAAVAL